MRICSRIGCLIRFYLLTMFIATYLTVGMRLALGILFSVFRNIRYGKQKAENPAKVMLIGAGDAARLVIDDLKYKCTLQCGGCAG